MKKAEREQAEKEKREAFGRKCPNCGAQVPPLTIDRDTLRWNKSATVWRAKFDQVLMKGRSLRGDPEFQKQLDYYENSIK